ncbi:hypothetical protein [Alphaspiravirus yamagawaense]|uniref:Uncharacterized protein n=1 Tax=Alphaspiravirus yamagawaense TaxID=1157339 RepID=J7QC59_9VIRU|nr:hypothetical protein [Aeropyrum coil-shaped virus]CCG27824.1 hypothetical protein [Aeropyrum coil-shaped virus]
MNHVFSISGGDVFIVPSSYEVAFVTLNPEYTVALALYLDVKVEGTPFPVKISNEIVLEPGEVEVREKAGVVEVVVAGRKYSGALANPEEILMPAKFETVDMLTIRVDVDVLRLMRDVNTVALSLDEDVGLAEGDNWAVIEFDKDGKFEAEAVFHGRWIRQAVPPSVFRARKDTVTMRIARDRPVIVEGYTRAGQRFVAAIGQSVESPGIPSRFIYLEPEYMRPSELLGVLELAFDVVLDYYSIYGVFTHYDFFSIGLSKGASGRYRLRHSLHVPRPIKRAVDIAGGLQAAPRDGVLDVNGALLEEVEELPRDIAEAKARVEEYQIVEVFNVRTKVDRAEIRDGELILYKGRSEVLRISVPISGDFRFDSELIRYFTPGGITLMERDGEVALRFEKSYNTWLFVEGVR